MNKHKIKKLNEAIRKILHEDLYEIISDDKEFNELFDNNEELNEETLLLDKEEMQVDYIVLPPNTPIDEIKKKFPEVIFTGEEKRNEEDAIDYIKHFKKPNGIYALRIGIRDNWFIGSYNSIN